MVNNVNLRLARNLKALRKKSNKKQLEMALLFNISQQNYSKLENGKTHFKNHVISKVCKIFQVSADEFFYGQNYSAPKLINPESEMDAMKRHYEVLLLESELRNVKLEQKIRNYIPFQETSLNDTPRIYVII